jgi:hypothetical protein
MSSQFIEEFVAVADEQTVSEGTTPSAATFRQTYEGKFDNDLELVASFGRGRASKVPWIGVLGFGQQIPQGIYPALLYYKAHHVLIVAYGVSQTNPPITQWKNSEKLKTITDFFAENELGEPIKYGNSFVFRAFWSKSGIDGDAVQEALTQLIDIFRRNFDERNMEDERESVESEGIDPSVPLMQKPFDPALINIDSRAPTIELLLKRIAQENPEIDLNTEHYFQRKDDLWDVQKQSRLIESILIRFPLPAFYFDGSDNNKWLVVDGLQRLSSLRNFVIRKNLVLTNLEFLTQLNGSSWDDLDRNLQRIIEETQVVAYIINPGTPEDVKFNIFKRINTGGLILEPQEIRHALNQGAPATFVAELAEIPEFKEATTNSISSKRMLDRDFVTRYLSFYLFEYRNYTPDLDTFMTRGMAKINELTEADREKCREDFRRSMMTNWEIFGRHAFRKIDRFSVKHRRNPLNKALFEVFSVLMAQLSETQRMAAVEKKTIMFDGLMRLIREDPDFLASISSSTGDKSRVNYRFRKITQLIQDSIEYDQPANA